MKYRKKRKMHRISKKCLKRNQLGEGWEFRVSGNILLFWAVITQLCSFCENSSNYTLSTPFWNVCFILVKIKLGLAFSAPFYPDYFPRLLWVTPRSCLRLSAPHLSE